MKIKCKNGLLVVLCGGRRGARCSAAAAKQTKRTLCWKSNKCLGIVKKQKYKKFSYFRRHFSGVHAGQVVIKEPNEEWVSGWNRANAFFFFHMPKWATKQVTIRNLKLYICTYVVVLILTLCIPATSSSELNALPVFQITFYRPFHTTNRLHHYPSLPQHVVRLSSHFPISILQFIPF